MVSQKKATLESKALEVFDTWLSHRIKHTHIPGLQVCVRKKGDIIFSKSYGLANTKTKRVLKNKDVFHIASHSKTLTGCALLILQEQKKLSLSDKITDYIPELKAHTDKRFQKITLRDLVSNRSGIFRDGTDSRFWILQKPFLTKKQILSEILSTRLVFAPDQQTKYSNIGFSLLGFVIEDVTGLSYADAMHALVLKTIKTKSMIPDYGYKKSVSYADGHMIPVLAKECQPFKHAPAQDMAAATGFCANAEETSLFLYEYLFGSSLVSKKTQAELKKTFWDAGDKAQYGLGIAVQNMGGHDFIGHGGGYPGFKTQTRHIKGTDFIISVFVNANLDYMQWILPSFISILNLIGKAFKQDNPNHITMSPVMLNNWGSSLYVCGKKKALSFWLDTGFLNNATQYIAKGKDTYYPGQKSGYDFPGEALKFHRKKNGTVSHITIGGASLYPEKTFLNQKLKNMLAS